MGVFLRCQPRIAPTHRAGSKMGTLAGPSVFNFFVPGPCGLTEIDQMGWLTRVRGYLTGSVTPTFQGVGFQRSPILGVRLAVYVERPNSAW